MGGEENLVVDNPGPVEIEEQAIEEIGESRFSNVLGTRTNTYYLLPIHIINYQQLMMYRVLRYCTKPYFSFTTP